jgi:transposase
MDHLFLGLDVAKDNLDGNVHPPGEDFVVTHDEVGLAHLVARLRAVRLPLVALQATGGYKITIGATLASATRPVAVVNPRHICDFARAIGMLAKTDTLDARVIARFAEAVRPGQRSAHCPPNRPSASVSSSSGAGSSSRCWVGRPSGATRLAIAGFAAALTPTHCAAGTAPSGTSRRTDLHDTIRSRPAWRETENLLTLGARGHEIHAGPSHCRVPISTSSNE